MGKPRRSRDGTSRFPMLFGNSRQIATPSIHLIMATPVGGWENGRSRDDSLRNFPPGDRESPSRRVFADALRIGVAYLAAKYRTSREVTRSPGSENLVMSGSYGRPLSRIQSSNHSRRNCRRVATISSYGPGWAGQARPGRTEECHRAASHKCVGTHGGPGHIDTTVRPMYRELRPSASAFGRMAKQPWGECSECASRCNFLSRLPRSDESRPSLYITRCLRIPGAISRDTRVATLQFRCASLGSLSPLPSPSLFRCHIIISYRCEIRSTAFHGRSVSLILDFVGEEKKRGEKRSRNPGVSSRKMYNRVH